MRVLPLIALAAAAALLCGCAQPAASSAAPALPDPTPPTAAPQASPDPTPPPAGAVRRIFPVEEGRRYEYKTFSYDAPGTGAMAMGLYTVIDYTAQTAQPLCSRPGCAHDTISCDAWETPPDGSRVALAADGDTLYLLHDTAGSETAWVEARSLTGADRRVLCQLEPFAGGLQTDWTLAAADGDTLYLDALQYSAEVSGQTGIGVFAVRVGVLAVSKTDGEASLYADPGPLPAEYARPAGQEVSGGGIVHAEGRSLYLWQTLRGGGSADTGELWRLDVDTGVWTLVAHYADAAPWQQEGLAGYDDWIAPAAASRPLAAGQLVHADEQAGTLAVIDAATGQERPLCAGLPAAGGGDADYEVQAFPDWYAVTVSRLDQTTRERTVRQFLIPAAGGDPAEVTLRQYSAARGTQTVRLMDQYGDWFYCHFETRATLHRDVDKDGTPIQFNAYELAYGLLPAADALAGRCNFIELYTN